MVVLLIMLPALAWYIWVIPQWTNTALIGGIGAESSFDYQSAIRNVWGVLHSMLPELLLNYGSVVFFIIGIATVALSYRKLMIYKAEILILLALVAYYFYEVNMIGLAHDYYLFPFLPLLFLLITVGVKQILNTEKKVVKAIGYGALCILPLTAFLRTKDRWRPMGMEKPLLLHKEELRSIVPNDALVIAGNDPSSLIFLYHIGKKGWTFEQNWLVASSLDEYVNNGATYLFSNSETINSDTTLMSYIEAPIFSKDGITVYPLRRLSDS
jgi:hypothetical protein